MCVWGGEGGGSGEGLTHGHLYKGSLMVWALYAYFSDSQNAAVKLLVSCM